MKRSFLGLALLCATLPTWASMHAGVQPTDFLGLMAYEFEHFLMHMGMVANALSALGTSPAMVFALLQDQSVCASLSPVVGLLFRTPVFALLTFALAFGGLSFIVFTMAHRATRRYGYLGLACRKFA